MPQPVRIIGSFVSPYVRKVLACLNLKGVAYEIDPITPFYGNEEFDRLSPLRRIPVFIDGDVTLADSSVICAYLEEAYPGYSLLPASADDRARARWLEEYADTRLGDLFIWSLFYQKVVRPLVWNEPGDEARIRNALDHGIPAALDYLERELPLAGFLFGDIGIADISIATFFRNGAYAGFEPDRDRWPRSTAFIERTLEHPCLATLLPLEDIQRSASVSGRRQALLDAGVRLTAETLGKREPQRGLMPL
jgi:glutathione S-transferase